MNLFVDTSALVKYYYPEAGSDQVEDLILKAKRIFLSELASVEFASALMKKIRMGEISEEDKSLIWDAFKGDLEEANLQVVSLVEDDFLKAAELIFAYGATENLRTLDSLQLVSALKVPNSHFLTADQRLVSLAGKLKLSCSLAP